MLNFHYVCRLRIYYIGINYEKKKTGQFPRELFLEHVKVFTEIR